MCEAVVPQPLQHGVVSDVVTVIGSAVSIEAMGPLDEPMAKFCNAMSDLDRFRPALGPLLANVFEVYLKQTASSPPAIGESPAAAQGVLPGFPGVSR